MQNTNKVKSVVGNGIVFETRVHQKKSSLFAIKRTVEELHLFFKVVLERVRTRLGGSTRRRRMQEVEGPNIRMSEQSGSVGRCRVELSSINVLPRTAICSENVHADTSRRWDRAR